MKRERTTSHDYRINKIKHLIIDSIHRGRQISTTKKGKLFKQKTLRLFDKFLWQDFYWRVDEDLRIRRWVMPPREFWPSRSVHRCPQPCGHSSCVRNHVWICSTWPPWKQTPQNENKPRQGIRLREREREKRSQSRTNISFNSPDCTHEFFQYRWDILIRR